MTDDEGLDVAEDNSHSDASVNDDEDQIENEGIRMFHRAIPHMHKLAQILTSHRRKRKEELSAVLCRTANCAQSGFDVLRGQRARRHGKKINAECGLSAPLHIPYKLFDSGISFEESAQKMQEQVSKILNRRNNLDNDATKELQEIFLDTEVRASVKRYQRRTFVLNLDKPPRTQVKNKTLEVCVKTIVGDPDLYISIAEPPTEKEYVWRSVLEGRDIIKIHPEDPNYRIGPFYIAVADTSMDCTFTLLARVVVPVQHNDEEIFARTQISMYRSIKAGIQVSEHRRKLCAGGKITNHGRQADDADERSIFRQDSKGLFSAEKVGKGDFGSKPLML